MRRKKSLSNPIIRHVQEYSSIYSFIIVLFLMGVVFGAIIVNSLSIDQKEDLFYYLNQIFWANFGRENCSTNRFISIKFSS